MEPVQVQETVENHLKSLLIKHFDPRKADSIFTEEGEVRSFPSFSYTASEGHSPGLVDAGEGGPSCGV